MSTRLPIRVNPALDEAGIVAEADRLFIGHGIEVTSLLEEARATGLSVGRLSRVFPSKESLVVASLRARHASDVRLLKGLRESGLSPRDILERALQGIVDDLVAPGFRGCPFLNAAAEVGAKYPDVAREVQSHREWYATEATKLLRVAGHPHPADAADDLVLARDGGMASIHGGNLIAAVGSMRRAIRRTMDEIGRDNLLPWH